MVPDHHQLGEPELERDQRLWLDTLARLVQDADGDGTVAARRVLTYFGSFFNMKNPGDTKVYFF